jgi:hypothetical protein
MTFIQSLITTEQLFQKLLAEKEYTKGVVLPHAPSPYSENMQGDKRSSLSLKINQ